MVMHYTGSGDSEYLPEEEIGLPTETSEVELTEVPPKEELRKFPKMVLLKIAIELDPDTVAESYKEGWTKDDILAIIERHVKGAIGGHHIEGWPYVQEVEIFDSEIEES